MGDLPAASSTTNRNVLAYWTDNSDPIRGTPEQFHTIFSKGPVPDPESSEYINAWEAFGSGKELLNNEERLPADGVISGNVLVLDALNDKNGLYKRFFDSRRDIRTMVIVADKLIIASPLHIPSVALQLYARQLVFKDSPEQQAVCIDVTPSSEWAPPTPATKDNTRLIPAQNGSAGQSPHQMTVYVQEVVASTANPRFVARGGDGQPAGQGRNGDNGIVNLPQPGQPGWVGFPAKNPGGIKFPPGTVYVGTAGGKTWRTRGRRKDSH